jgi:hypothetical protein
VTGIARGSTGLPLANTEIRVRGARSSAVTDSAGRFSVAALPAGTHMFVARHLGYEPAEASVELRAGRTVERDVQHTRVISLDSVRVVAMRSQYPEFESNRRFNPFGRYLGPDEVERRHATKAMELLAGMPGVTTAGRDIDQRALSTHAARRCAGMRVYLDGTEVEYINDVAASQIGAVEVYVDGAFVPSRYAARGSCGVVVFWSKAARQVPSPKPAAAPASP